MHFLRSAAAAAALLVAGVAFGSFDRPGRGSASAEPAPEAAGAALFRLTAAGRDGDCTLAAGESVAEGVRALRFSAGCSAIDPALAGPAFWHERPHGAVAIVDDFGQVVAEFGVSDGAAYESFRPAAPLMLLTEGG